MYSNSNNDNTNNVATFENDNSTRVDDQMSASASVFLRGNENCLKVRPEQNVRRPRSRSFSEPGDLRRNLESDFFFAAHLDLDRQTLFDPKKVVEKTTSNEDVEEGNKEVEEEEEETSF